MKNRYRQYNYLNSIEHGNIIIPTKVDRDEYVNSCFSKERVTIMGAGGNSAIHNCYIDRATLKEINFPLTDKELGDTVMYVVNSFNNKPVILGRLSKESETQLLDEGEFRLEKSFNDTHISIVGKAKTGDLLIDVENNNGKGALIINVTGGEEGSTLKLKCKGVTTIYADDAVNLETVGEVNIKSRDEVDDTKFTNVKVTNGKFEINDGTDPILLGGKTVAQLDKEVQALTDLITSIANIIPVNVISGSPDATWGTWQAAVALIIERGEFSAVKSEISFTD